MNKSTDLRKSAKGQQCMIRLPGICSHDSTTVVLCHDNGSLNLGGKNNDMRAAFGCVTCHDEYDRRTRKLERGFVQTCFYEAILRTQQYWLENGYLTWSGCDVRRKDARATERLAVWVRRMSDKLL